MKILQVATHKRVTRGGAIQMVRLARALQGRGHQVTLVFNKGSQEGEQGITQLRKEGFTVALFPMDGLNLHAMLSFRRFVTEGGFHVIHAHRDPALRFVFFSLMGLDVPLVAQRGTTYRPRRLIRWIMKSPRVFWIAAVAYAVKETLVGSEVPPDKIRVVYLDRPLLYLQTLDYEERYGHSIDLKTWGFAAGPLVKDKESFRGTLIEALDHPETYSDVRRKMAAHLFYNPGHATQKAVDVIRELLDE